MILYIYSQEFVIAKFARLAIPIKHKLNLHFDYDH